MHDYIKEFGGAERVLKTLSEMYPKAPIYTAFSVNGSTAEKELKDKKIIESWLAPLLKIWKLYSPLRFLTPLVWGTMDLSKYDLIITSCSWYITRGFKVGTKTKVIAYCHTPPRWLYEYETSVGFTKYWPVKMYSAIVGHFMRMYDFKTSQKINFWIANSENVRQRIRKFYRKEAKVIYPPIDVENISEVAKDQRLTTKSKDGYFLIVSRLVGAKGLEETVGVFSKLGSKYKLKIVGESHGYSDVESRIKQSLAGSTGKNQELMNVELMGRVNDDELYKLYAGARGFIALARDEDFGMTVVESMAAGTPVIAFNGGGYRESVVNGVTGLLIDDIDENTIKEAIKKFEKVKWDREKIKKHAQKFSKERFVGEIRKFVANTKQ